MKSEKTEKTNVMRVLEQHKIAYTPHTYGDGVTAVSAGEVAAALGQDPTHVFKTLVTVGKSGQHYVFVIPGPAELDLKKAAAAVGEKNIEMVKSKELLPLTGYIHGGCSPIGMKKFFTTTVDESAKDCATICVSGGRIGFQVEFAPADLGKVIRFAYADVIVRQ
jgi:Cys-tRNA(Pro)/Cys-tRNA(Cys) deacylase